MRRLSSMRPGAMGVARYRLWIRRQNPCLERRAMARVVPQPGRIGCFRRAMRSACRRPRRAESSRDGPKLAQRGDRQRTRLRVARSSLPSGSHRRNALMRTSSATQVRHPGPGAARCPGGFGLRSRGLISRRTSGSVATSDLRCADSLRAPAPLSCATGLPGRTRAPARTFPGARSRDRNR